MFAREVDDPRAMFPDDPSRHFSKAIFPAALTTLDIFLVKKNSAQNKRLIREVDERPADRCCAIFFRGFGISTLAYKFLQDFLLGRSCTNSDCAERMRGIFLGFDKFYSVRTDLSFANELISHSITTTGFSSDFTVRLANNLLFDSEEKKIDSRENIISLHFPPSLTKSSTILFK